MITKQSVKVGLKVHYYEHEAIVGEDSNKKYITRNIEGVGEIVNFDEDSYCVVFNSSNEFKTGERIWFYYSNPYLQVIVG